MSLKANSSVLIGFCLVHILPYDPIYIKASVQRNVTAKCEHIKIFIYPVFSWFVKS